MLNNKTVAVAMSGGVDSSVAAALLLRQGYKVIGITMRLWADPQIELSSARLAATEKDAEAVTKILGIEHHVVDFQDVFKQNVVKYFAQEYNAGRTPNPCVVCNKKIKFGELYEKAKALGADYLATGHYVRVVEDESGFKRIGMATYLSKDQSYVLYHLNQEILQHVLFPLGEYDKQQVREMAKEMNLPVFDKKDSQEICFIPDDDYHRFLNSFCGKKEKAGNVVDSVGRILGKHQGISNYTVGQRKGLGIAAATPLYVLKIDAESNEVVLGTAAESMCRGVLVTDVVFSDELPFIERKEIKVKIRYNAKPVAAIVEPGEKAGQAKVTFGEPQRAAAPGQAAVFYQNDYCIGGGVILRGIKAGA